MFNKEVFENLPFFRKKFEEGDPFPYVVIEDALMCSVAQTVHDSFPSYDQMQWYYNSEKYIFEPGKTVVDAYEKAPLIIKKLLDYLGSDEVVQFLSTLSQISGLFIDPSFHGGFLHQSPRGGKLGIHLDRELHRHHSNWKRELTLIIYVNPGWQENWNGDLQFWQGLESDGFRLQKCVTRVFPKFNRMVIFQNTAHAYHGFPQILECPEDTTRKCIVVYYYTEINDHDNLVRTGGRYFLTIAETITDELKKQIEYRTKGAG